MAGKNLLPHGFKAQAERTSASYRQALALEPHDHLCGFKLAEHLGIDVCTPQEFFPAGTNFDNLLGTAKVKSEWSALTMTGKSGKRFIIHNPLHAPTRQQSNLMHELANIICEHEYPTTYANINLPEYMRSYDPKQEQEANHLGSVLQINRDGLVWALKKRMANDEICNHFVASPEMLTLRINATAVKRQLSYLFK